jgi:hypothetical protein
MRKPEIAIYYSIEMDRIRIVYINNKHLSQTIIDYDYDSMSPFVHESIMNGYQINEALLNSFEKIGQL